MTLRQRAFHAAKDRSVGVLFTGALLVVLVRPLPIFPDLMWEGFLFAINRAVATPLQFGRDVILTHGPYSCVYTSRYYPGLEHLRLGGQMLIALAYSAAVLALFDGWKRWLLPLFIYVMTIAAKPLFCDAVFYLLPWLLVMLASRYVPAANGKVNWRDAARLSLITFALSVIALTKASFSLATFFLVALALGLIWTKQKRVAAGLGALFLAAMLSFWSLAGQPLATIADSFVAQIPMISGYTDAISNSGRVMELVAYLLLAAVAVGSVAWRLFIRRGEPAPNLVLLIALSAILFLAFKGAYVRHAAHGMIAADAIALICFTLVAILPRWNGLPLLAGALVFFATVNAYYSHQPVPYLPHPRLNPLTRGYWSDLINPFVEGLRCQIDGDRMEAHYARSLETLSGQIPLPQVEGPTDIHDSRYDLLAAHRIEISQRPIPESYSAYTPELARLNAAHFGSEARPENVFVRVTAIDNRLPSLEDSLSWPHWLSLYELRPEQSAPYMLLTRRREPVRKPEFSRFDERHARMGEEITLPEDEAFVWAEIEVPSPLLGSVTSLLFKRPGLTITYRYADGAHESFRYIEGMGRAGFLLSPVVRNNADFVALHAQRLEHFGGRVPVSFAVTVGEKGEPFWSDTYRVRLSKLTW